MNNEIKAQKIEGYYASILNNCSCYNNNEIKESINRIQNIVDFYKLNDENNYDYSDDVLISMKTLLDYITNLQQKVEQYENPNDLTLFYMWLDEKAKDKMKELQDEIQNLRGSLKTYAILLKTNVEENEKLKEENEHLQKQNNGLHNLIIQHVDKEDNLIDYKSRCEKTIEYIKGNEWAKDYENSNCRTHLLNILNGDDKSES